MDFWFAIYISSCQLLILLLRFTQFQRCLNVPGCLMRHFPTSFFGRLPGGGGGGGSGNLYSQGTTTQLTFLLNYSWNIFIQISILQQIETAVLFICVSSIHVLFIDAQISATTATPCTNRRRQRLVACDVSIPILHCIGQALTLSKFVGRESRVGAHQHKYNQAEKL